MVANPTLHQSSSSNPVHQVESITPTDGVITLFGFGIAVRVDRGHLVLDDGIAETRRRARFARIGHGLRRLVIIGADGHVTLAALRWLADQGVTFVMLDHDGTVLVTTGPVRPSDARLRRAQSLAHHSGIAGPIMRRLIDQKLAGQLRVVRDLLHDVVAEEQIAVAGEALPHAEAPGDIRSIEARAALAYWFAWHDVPVQFPRIDMARIPDHWKRFGARRSPLTNSPRLAINPPNGMLNLLYGVLENEATRAANKLGLDCGLGILHVDTDARDSFALDLLEPVRPDIDFYVLSWLQREPLHRSWFIELGNGNCRLAAPFAAKLVATAPTWARAVAPVAEWVAAALRSSTMPRSREVAVQPTLLTQRRRREAKGKTVTIEVTPPPPPRLCRGCGALRGSKRGDYCTRCGCGKSREAFLDIAARGRLTTNSPAANEKRAEALQRNAAAERAWNDSKEAIRLSAQDYVERIQPGLPCVKVSTIVATLSVSKPYASAIRAGRRRPHPRHWPKLATLVGLVKRRNLQ